MKRIAFIINGTAKGVKNLKRELSEKLHNLEISFLESTYAGEAIELAQKAMEDNVDYLIAVGGDGSVNEVVNGCMNSHDRSSKKTIIGVLPHGSGNDLARSLGVTKEIDQLKTLISNSSYGAADVGKIEFMNSQGQQDSRYFINIADVGIGGVAAEMLGKSSRFMGAEFTYHKVILQSFLSYKPVKVNLKSADYNWEGEILSLCMANGRYFANGMCIAPQANISDGKIQLVIMGKVSILDYVLNLSKIKKGIALVHPEINYIKVDSCTIEAKENACPIDMDGEFIGYAPLKLSVIGKSLKFLKAV
jgi:YegS/Rv2252/BmrU family lipid kinase